jgi:hypothetical protein
MACWAVIDCNHSTLIGYRPSSIHGGPQTTVEETPSLLLPCLPQLGLTAASYR